MSHKDAIGQDIMPDDIVAYAPAKQSAGFRFGVVVGETPKNVRVVVRYSLDEIQRRPPAPGSYSSSLTPSALIVINKIVRP